MVKQLLDLVVGILGGARSAALVESAEASLGAVRAGNLLFLPVSNCSTVSRIGNLLTSLVEVSVTAA